MGINGSLYRCWHIANHIYIDWKFIIAMLSDVTENTSQLAPVNLDAKSNEWLRGSFNTTILTVLTLHSKLWNLNRKMHLCIWGNGVCNCDGILWHICAFTATWCNLTGFLQLYRLQNKLKSSIVYKDHCLSSSTRKIDSTKHCTNSKILAFLSREYLLVS